MAALIALLLAAGCGRSNSTPAAAASAAAAATPAAQPPSLAHGDHNPHHGGVVLMKGDLHYEAVFDPTGRAYQLYFSDAMREDLPAAYASAVSFTVKRKGEADELVPMQIDASGESWIGSGRAVADAGAATVRITFTVDDEPYFIDVPWQTNGAGVPGAASSPPPRN
jgi:hypothetical protein